jgi:hypothetical protein
MIWICNAPPNRRPWLWAVALPLAVAGGAAGEELVEKYPDGTRKAVYAVAPDGRKNGPFEEFHPDGRRAAKGTYRNDRLNGVFQSHHANGKVRIKATYKDGSLTGKFIEHDAAGPVLRSAEYRDDKLNGGYQEFADGKLIRDEFWVGGELVAPKSAAQIAATLQAIEKGTVTSVGELPEVGDRWRSALADATLQAGRETALKRLQAYRYLCDVPWEDVVLDRMCVAHCEAACDIMHRVGELTHTPKNPGMPENEYRFAFKGTNSSNIFNSPAMIDSITAFMDDSDPRNIDRLGHRRWCINPRMLKTGVAGNHGYSAMWSLDNSRRDVPDYRFVAFPPRGLTPVTFFKAHYAWSCSLNPEKYAAPDPAKVAVTVHPCRFNARQGTVEKPSPPLPLNFSKVDLGGFGIPNCIIFRPADVIVAPGATYWVEITGLKDLAGQEAPLGYAVGFIKL